LSLRLAALALLSATPMTGYDLVKYFDENVGLLWAAPHSQIYPELRRMREDGLIEAEAMPRGRNATKHVYSVTDAGHAYLRELVAETAPYPAERDLHRLKLAYAELADLDDARRQLEAHLEHWQRRAEISERLLRGAREGSWPLLVERLKRTPPEQHEATVAFKVFAFEGQIARAGAEIEWARRGLALIERLRHSGAPETAGDALSSG
jgi:PadR family transcriptional regulator AphA